MKKMLEEITLDNLDNEQRELAETIGLDSYKELVYHYGGGPIYVPKMETFERMKRNENIKREFDGYNFRALGYKYGLTTVQIRTIVSDIVNQKKSQPVDGQISLFDTI